MVGEGSPPPSVGGVVGRGAQKQNGARNPPGAAQDVPRGVCFLQISKCKFGQVFKFVIHIC